MHTDELLILDMGLYPAASELRAALNDSEQEKAVMALDARTMNPADWDAVLDRLLRARGCITL